MNSLMTKHPVYTMGEGLTTYCSQFLHTFLWMASPIVWGFQWRDMGENESPTDGMLGDGP